MKMKSSLSRLALATALILLTPAVSHAGRGYGVAVGNNATAVRTPRGAAVVGDDRAAVATRRGVAVTGPNGTAVARGPVAAAPLPRGYVRVVPSGYRMVAYRGYNCYYVGGIYYRAVMYGGSTVYVIVD